MKSPLKINRKKLLLITCALFLILIFSSAKAAVHSKHVVDNGVQCSFCHNNFAHTISGAAPHDTPPKFNYLSGSKDLDTNGIGTITGFYDGAGLTCEMVDCHGENSVATAALPLDCAACHSNTADSPAPADINDFTFAGTTPVMAKVRTFEWEATGHGSLLATFTGSGNPTPSAEAAGIAKFTDCTTYCHTKTVMHNESTTNPFRLTTTIDSGSPVTDFSDVASTLDNTVCLDCHSS
ncbi:hypothetical protein ACFL2A_06930, partial [Thermodesulfobacteriota bacterium]